MTRNDNGRTLHTMVVLFDQSNDYFRLSHPAVSSHAQAKPQRNQSYPDREGLSA
jgi:hypothetical protein